jgi:hypothetical protein
MEQKRVLGNDGFIPDGAEHEFGFSHGTCVKTDLPMRYLVTKLQAFSITKFVKNGYQSVTHRSTVNIN